MQGLEGNRKENIIIASSKLINDFNLRKHE